MSPRNFPISSIEGLTIGETSLLLAVPAPTLRSWELRYGLPTTPRSTGGHRRYMPAEITQLRYMRDEIATGRPAAAAAGRTRAHLAEPNPAGETIAAILEQTRLGDAEAVRSCLDQARASLGMGPALDTVVLPAMRQVGALWESGNCALGEPQFASQVIRGWLSKLTTLVPAAMHERGVLLAVGPRDLHTLGMEALSALLSDQGTGCRVLSSRTPTRVLVATALTTSPAAVVVVSHLGTQRRYAIESVSAVAETGTATFYAGNAFTSATARKDVPGQYLGETLTGAAELIQAHLNSPRTG
jgi:DNA-binding transcriptional MerR regulator/methylmalonyl-CoA mutase cobalamin-binding subunit